MHIIKHISFDTALRIVLVIGASLSLVNETTGASNWNTYSSAELPEEIARVSKLRPARAILLSHRTDLLSPHDTGWAIQHEDSAAVPQEEITPAPATVPEEEKSPEPAEPPQPPAVEEEEVAASKSPPGAAIRSLVLPGWGQFYTGCRIKGVLFAGAQVSLFTLWQVEKKAGDRDFDEYVRTDDSSLLTSSNSHFEKADNYLSYGILATLISVLDAYIDAHLYKFEEKVRMDDDGSVEVSLRIY
jgi:hypothetical protein